MAVYPLEVDINPAHIARLTKLFKFSYKQIVNEINSATGFGVANRRAILRQIDRALQELGVDVEKFIEKELPGYYREGANEAVNQLNNVGAEIGVKKQFNLIHKDAIAALVDDTAKGFAESMTGVSRSARLLLGKVTREAITAEIAKGLTAGEALRTVRRTIKGTLQEQGLTALVDKAGRRWELDRYAEMLFRTKAVEARNRGLINRMEQNGYDLVQVSSHEGCDLCKPWEGEILSATGSTPGYKTVAEAEAAGLFHPNCKHAINVLIPKLAKETSAYE